MEKKTCEKCGRGNNPEDLVIHRIVPEEVAKQAGIMDARTISLCINCSNDYQIFTKKVHDLSYDEMTKYFIPKLPSELIKEYELAYKAFIAYKK